MDKQNEIYFLLGYEFGLKKAIELNHEDKAEITVSKSVYRMANAVMLRLVEKGKDLDIFSILNEIKDYVKENAL